MSELAASEESLIAMFGEEHYNSCVKPQIDSLIVSSSEMYETMAKEALDIAYSQLEYLPESIENLLEYLPLSETLINDYIDKICRVIAINYNRDNFDTAYFNSHLIFMLFIYGSVWKISERLPTRYNDAILFIRPYRGKENVNLNSITTIFDYSVIPEKDIFDLFQIVDLDKGEIGKIKEVVATRNDMAHATGKTLIPNVGEFDRYIQMLLVYADKIMSKMKPVIRNWYEEKLLEFASGTYADGSEIVDIATDYWEQLLEDFSLSTMEISICAEFGISKFSDYVKYPTLGDGGVERLRLLHNAVLASVEENITDKEI